MRLIRERVEARFQETAEPEAHPSRADLEQAADVLDFQTAVQQADHLQAVPCARLEVGGTGPVTQFPTLLGGKLNAVQRQALPPSIRT